MSEWKKMRFLDFIELHRGFDLTKDAIKDGPYPVVCSTSIMGYHKDFKVKGPGVVTGRSGTLGETQYVKDDFWPHNTTLYVKDFKNNNRMFVYYFLKNFDIASMGGGAAIPSLNRNVLSNISVTIPDLKTQIRIATILARYDSLIENYQKQIKLLEEAAQRLYKEWFIDLRFPGHENTKMVDGLPEGWEKRKINTFVNLQNGYAFKSSTFEEDGIYKIVTIKNVKDGVFDGENNSLIRQIPDKMPNHCRLKTGDILLSLTGNVGRICIVVGDDYLLNQRVAKLETCYPAFTYCLFRNNDMFVTVNNLANGAAQQNVSPIRIGELNVLFANDLIMSQFENLVGTFCNKIINLYALIRLITEARDRLLPKLMDGEIELKET